MQDWETMIAERVAAHGVVVTCLIADARVRNKKAAQKRIFKAHYDEDPQHFIALSRAWKKENPEAVSAHHKELWRKQAKAMQEYVDVLGERIKDLIDNG